MVLRLRPELVRMDVAKGATIPFESAFYCPDFSRPSRVDVPRAFDQLSATGAFGHPEIADGEKGEALFAAAPLVRGPGAHEVATKADLGDEGREAPFCGCAAHTRAGRARNARRTNARRSRK